MNSELIYQDLLEQYKSLTEQEQKALLVYNSNFYYHINSISRIEGFENKSPEDIFMLLEDNNSFVNKFVLFKRVIMYPQNMVVRYSVFKDISFNDILSFIESIKCVCQVLKEARLKIKLCDDMKVYRGISVSKDTNVIDISKSKFISTSIKVDDANDFIYQNNSDKSCLFVLNLEKGTNVLVTPLSLVYDYNDAISMLHKDTNNATLKIANRRSAGQQEIILFSDDLEFVTTNVRNLPMDDCLDLTVYNVDAKLKLEIKSDKRMNM